MNCQKLRKKIEEETPPHNVKKRSMI